VQLTKIFNIKNINKHIIYILPHHLDEETINYYYKIMELEEIPNYKERVWFLEVDPRRMFKNSISLTDKLYYNS
jgi:IQ domain-containing protein H